MLFKQKILLILSLFVLGICTNALASGQQVLAERVRQTMRISADFYRSISSNGGYAGIYSIDLQDRYREKISEKSRIKSTEIWVQPPGTPSVGMIFLRAYKITGNDYYLIAAKEVGYALAWGQSIDGGWGYKVDVSKLNPDFSTLERKKRYCTFDDNVTQGALEFLISLDEIVDKLWLTEAVNLGLEFIIKAQFPNGAWPQFYPLMGGHYDYYTFNDKAINDCIKIMLQAHRVYQKQSYLQSAMRGGDFIILSQLPGPQAGWAQQYSHDLKPAPARRFEPVGVCSLVTSRNIRTLVDLYLHTREERYIATIPQAVDWLEKSRIGPNKWSRLYEIGTNKPIFGNRNGKVCYSFYELSKKQQRSYSWYAEFGISKNRNYYNEVKRLGIDGYIGRKSMSSSASVFTKKVRRVKKIVDATDKNGRWIRNNMIYIHDFVKNFNLLCEYLEIVNSH